MKRKIRIMRKDGIPQRYTVGRTSREILRGIRPTTGYPGRTNLEQYQAQRRAIERHAQGPGNTAYLYHATFQNRLNHIMKEGLKRNPSNKNWEESADGIYFAWTPEGAIQWYQDPHLFSKKPSHMGKPILLRVEESKMGEMAYDQRGSAYCGDACFLLKDKDIAPADLEVYLDKPKKWIRLIDYEVNIEPIIGYNSYGRWDSLRHIKELELDRGNEWFDDSSYDLDKDEAIWVTKDPGVALRYPYSSILWDLKPGDKAPEGFEQEWDEFQAKLRDPTPYVVKVDLTGAEEVLSDGDGGWLYVRRGGNDQPTR